MLVEVPMLMGVNNAIVVDKAKAVIGINYHWGTTKPRWLIRPRWWRSS